MQVSKNSRMAMIGAAGMVLGLSQVAAAGDDVSLAVLEIQGVPVEYDSGMSWLGDGADTLLGLVNAIDTLAFDDEFDGLVIRLKDAGFGTTQIEELGQALERFKDEGKKVHIFAEGYDTGGLMLASYADEVLLQEGGYISFPGMHMEEMYMADMFEWIGVKAQMVQVGDYKGANETTTRSGPSAQWDQNISSLLDGMYANVRSIMMEGRGLNDRELDEAMRVAWAASGEEAMEVDLIDGVVDLPELKEHLSDVYDADVSWVTNPYAVYGPAMDFSNPFAFMSMMSQQNTVSIDHPTIGVLHINGVIVDGDSGSGGLFGGGDQVGSRTIRNAIESMIKEDLIKGVVIRIDSPGGSAIASEIMWQGIERLKEHKPVWVSVGGMAASGGYYVLVGGEKVFVNPSSVVGSIGVVGGKYAIGDVYERLHLNIVERSRGPVAGLFGTQAWNDEQIELIREEMTDTYNLFTSRVEAGRDGINLSKTAEGRLFVGSDAIELKMADEIGGLDDAINDLADELDLVDFDVAHYPAPPSFENMIQQMLGGFIEAPGVAVGQSQIETTLRMLLGEERYLSVVDELNGMMLLRDEPVLLVNPRALFIR
ncbi:MAG: S49 family peptidase [Phycisphaerales bacterium]|nr:S49 family peptidase [Phycisphaerales bacterium]